MKKIFLKIITLNLIFISFALGMESSNAARELAILLPITGLQIVRNIIQANTQPSHWERLEAAIAGLGSDITITNPIGWTERLDEIDREETGEPIGQPIDFPPTQPEHESSQDNPDEKPNSDFSDIV